MRRNVLYMWLGLLGAGLAGADRPRDPWVFRCVLDKHPRMVVIALDEDLWVAYNATDCTLYRAWAGDVKFQGAVYNAVHGPQPVVRGEVWMDAESDAQRPLLLVGPNAATALPRWGGYRFEGDAVWLIYEFRTNDGEVVTIRESPEVTTAPDGRKVFRREFAVEGLPEDWSLYVPLDHEDASGGSIVYLERVGNMTGRILLETGEASLDGCATIDRNGRTTFTAVMPGEGG